MRILFFAIALLAFAAPAMACSCLPDAFSPEASRRNIMDSQFIFDGAVLKVDPPPAAQEEGDPPPSKNSHYSKVAFSIDNLYRGDAAQSVTVYVDVGSSCGRVLKEGEKGFFMIHVFREEYVLAGQCDVYISPQDMAALKRGDFMDASGAPLVSKKLDVPFVKSFISAGDLEEWAKTSTLGGGSIEKKTFFGEKLIFVYRSYTSGVESSDVGVYQMKDNQWILIKSHEAILNRRIEAAQDPNGIAFKATDNGEVIMTLTPRELAK